MYLNLNIEVVKILKISLEMSAGKNELKTKGVKTDEKTLDTEPNTTKPK